MAEPKPDDYHFWVAAFSGGLAGAMLTQGWQWLVTYWNSRKLQADFGKQWEGCVVENVAFRDREGFLGQKKYLRLRVFNNGLTMAKDVQVIIVKISAAGSSNKWSSSGEVFDAFWSSADRNLRMDIPSKTPRFADLCSASDDPNRGALEICAGGGNIGHLKDKDVRGTISLEICITAQNAKTITKGIKFTFDGTANGLLIVG